MEAVERLVTDQLAVAKSRLESIAHTTLNAPTAIGVDASHALLDSLDDIVALVASIEGQLLLNTVRHLTTSSRKRRT